LTVGMRCLLDETQKKRDTAIVVIGAEGVAARSWPQPGRLWTWVVRQATEEVAGPLLRRQGRWSRKAGQEGPPSRPLSESGFQIATQGAASCNGYMMRSLRVDSTSSQMGWRRRLCLLLPLIGWIALRMCVLHTLRQAKPGKGGRDVRRTSETFRWNPAGNQSRPAEPGQRPEASFASGAATYRTKRKQRVLKPCH
jgi:hypothetical protein